MSKFVPLHVHSEYSLLDGAIRVRDLVDFAVENDMPAIAITDHGVMYSAIEFYEYAKEKGIKPLIGCEFYVHNGDIHERDKNNNPCYHLVLIAKDNTGYLNLIKLVSTAWCEGFHRHPRINWELIQKYHDGLICCSACLGGELLCALKNHEKAHAKEIAKQYQDLFGDDYYIELQDHGLEDQRRTNPDLIEIAQELRIKMVLTNDSHYLRKSDADMHDTLLCLNTNSDKDDPNRFHFENNEFYVKTKDEMRVAFKWMDSELFEKCISNTQEVADKCTLEIELGNAPLPHYEVPHGYTTETYLNHLVMEGLKARYGEHPDESLYDRAKYELSVIEKMGFPAYFLITWDFINFAKQHDIPVGPGRGSAAGSIVAYALGITDIDPIEHKLLFERFLNPERYTMPDIDIDFCIERRGEVIDYVVNKYGEDKVCQIITFMTYAPKAAFKGVGRILRVPFAESNRLTALIDPAIEIAKATNDKAEWLKDAITAEGSEFKALYDDPDYEIEIPDSGKKIKFKRWVDLAIAIEGLKNGTGTHAAGVIISHAPLDTILPVQPSKDASGIVQTGYPKHEATEVLNLLKMDFLGLRNLTMIIKTVKMVEKYHGIKIDINHLPLDDKPTYDMLCRGETVGVFQLESQGMTNLVKRLKPDVFEDLGALVALFRPGPLGSGMVDDFVARKHGEQEITYAHPDLEPVLKDTYGTIVYQEQIMQVFQILADYSLGEADKVRRMMGKKDQKAMEEQRGKFIEASAKHGMKKENAENLFNQILKFASYCFNRAHSAAYAFVAYQTAYLKCHFPVEYLSALLSSVADRKDQTQLYIEEAQKFGISILPPDINKSYLEYTPDDKNIRFGLAAIKGVGENVVKAIISEREENGEFKDIFDFCTRLESKYVNKKSLEGLIKAGAFSNISKSRKQLLDNLDHILSSTSKIAKEREMGQVSLFSAMGDDSGFNQFQLSGSDAEYSDKIIQQFEKEFLGFYITSHPLQTIFQNLPFLKTHTISQLKDMPDYDTLKWSKSDTRPSMATICGLVTSVRKFPDKKDPTKNHIFGVVEDLTDKIEVAIFSKISDKYEDFFKPESKVIISGHVQHREENSTSLVADSVKPVENSNILTITLADDLKFEELIAVKDILAKFHGSDPVVFNLKKTDNRILTNSIFWVNASNDLVNVINKNFKDKLDVSIKSADTTSDEEEESLNPM